MFFLQKQKGPVRRSVSKYAPAVARISAILAAASRQIFPVRRNSDW
jgi:hypothetical protein